VRLGISEERRDGGRKMKGGCLLGAVGTAFKCSTIGVKGPAAKKRLRHKRHTSTAAGKTARLVGPLWTAASISGCIRYSDRTLAL
jgi:hypothetical protein